MQPGVDFLNIEYLLVRPYEFIPGFQGAVAGFPDWIHATVYAVVVTGMALSFFFIILIVYAQIKLLQTEHGGFHAMEAESHEQHEAEVEQTGRNDRWERIVELMEQGYEGAGVGDQLKMANPIQMTTLDLAWKAHKVRNDIAHGGEGYKLEERDVRVAIDYYKRVFEELGAI